MNQIKSEKIPCSVGILTLNSAKTLRRCLESVKDFAEIIICDGNSTDETLALAREYNCKIIKQHESNEPNIKIKDYSETRNKMLKAASFDWFFHVDSDEFISDDLKNEIAEIVKESNSKYLIYRVRAKLIFEGRVIEHCSSYPGYQNRFFNKKSGGYFVKPVHEKLEFDKDKYQLGTLKYWWYIPISKQGFKDFWKNYKRYVFLEIKRERNKNFYYFVKCDLVLRPLKIIKLILKIIFIYVRYGFKETLPLKAEFQRTYYAVYLFLKIIQSRFKFNRY